MTDGQKADLIARVTETLEAAIFIGHSEITYRDQGKTVEMSFDLVVRRETADEAWANWGGVWNSDRKGQRI